MRESHAARALREFHDKFGLTVQKKPTMCSEQDKKLRINLIVEEAAEFADALEKDDLVEAADALADLIYVTYGAAVTLGINVDEVFQEVHRSNMTKVWDDGTVHRREEDGKILKPPSYSPADVSKIVKRQMQRED